MIQRKNHPPSPFNPLSMESMKHSDVVKAPSRKWGLGLTHATHQQRGLIHINKVIGLIP